MEAGVPTAGAAAVGASAAPARDPKKISAKVRFRVLDSKLDISMGLTTVTSAPFSTLASGTAAQTSPLAV